METLEKILSNYLMFHNLSEKHLKILSGVTTLVQFHPDELILPKGEKTQYFYLIRKGRVVLEEFLEDKGAMTLQVLGEGDILGWSWLVPPYRWHFDGKAVDEVEAFRIDAEKIRAKMNEDHDLGYELLRRFINIVVDRLQATRLHFMGKTSW